MRGGGGDNGEAVAAPSIYSCVVVLLRAWIDPLIVLWLFELIYSIKSHWEMAAKTLGAHNFSSSLPATHTSYWMAADIWVRVIWTEFVCYTISSNQQPYGNRECTLSAGVFFHFTYLDQAMIFVLWKLDVVRACAYKFSCRAECRTRERETLWMKSIKGKCQAEFLHFY